MYIYIYIYIYTYKYIYIYIYPFDEVDVDPGRVPGVPDEVDWPDEDPDPEIDPDLSERAVNRPDNDWINNGLDPIAGLM
jgi:hypothetical protein